MILVHNVIPIIIYMAMEVVFKAVQQAKDIIFLLMQIIISIVKVDKLFSYLFPYLHCFSLNFLSILKHHLSETKLY